MHPRDRGGRREEKRRDQFTEFNTFPLANATRARSCSRDSESNTNTSEGGGAETDDENGSRRRRSTN
jgi:hypothetical protein